MSKITTTVAFVAAALLSSGAAMAQSNEFNSMVIDYGRAPGLSAKADAAVAAAKTRAEVVAELGNNAQAIALARADAELGIAPAARKTTTGTMLAKAGK